jgi:hypothetical protein
MNLAILIYQDQYMPLSSQLMNRLELANEFLIDVATFNMALFTDYVLDYET